MIMLLTLFAHIILLYVNILHLMVELFYYGFLVNEGIGLILGEEIASCKSHIASVSLTNGCLMGFFGVFFKYMLMYYI